METHVGVQTHGILLGSSACLNIIKIAGFPVLVILCETEMQHTYHVKFEVRSSVVEDLSAHGILWESCIHQDVTELVLQNTK